MQPARLANASNLESQAFIEFPQRTNGPGLGRAKPLHAIVGIPMPMVQRPRSIGIQRSDLTAK
jgi:hypothetical protein